jgi:hypothetical protein
MGALLLFYAHQTSHDQEKGGRGEALAILKGTKATNLTARP